jgi:N-methylhydantoinase B
MVDPVTLEIIRNRLDAISGLMQLTLLKSSVSVILKEGEDCSCGLFKSNGEMLSQACANPIHLGIMGPAVEAVLKSHPSHSMQEGDIYILNDPYNGGTHLPDVIMVAPVVIDGAVAAISAALAHQEDIGGRSFGSMPADATEIFQEGFIIPPLLFYRAGARDKSIVALIRSNVRLPDCFMGDIEAQIASVKVGVRSYREMVSEFGRPTIDEAVDTLFDQAENLTRSGIEAIPDGEYRFDDWVDNDGIDLDVQIRLSVKITVKGTDVVVDFSESAAQVRGPANVGYWGTFSAVIFAFRAICNPDIPTNAGMARPIKMIIPLGKVLNPVWPAPVSLRAHTAKRVVDVLYGALAKAVPGRAIAASSGSLSVCSFGGAYESGELFGCSDIVAGGMGGRRGKDGIDLLETDITNCMNIPVEALEAHFPLRVVRSHYRTDSGGAGEHRGGLGLDRAIEVVRGPIRCSYRSDRHLSRPWGIGGGHAGLSWETHIRRANGKREPVRSKAIFELQDGDVLEMLTGGGGGYGDPFERAPEMVLQDVVNGKVSEHAAERDYGVVLNRSSRNIDRSATNVLRETRRAKRGSARGKIDRGDGVQE